MTTLRQQTIPSTDKRIAALGEKIDDLSRQSMEVRDCTHWYLLVFVSFLVLQYLSYLDRTPGLHNKSQSFIFLFLSPHWPFLYLFFCMHLILMMLTRTEALVWFTGYIV